MEAWHVSEIPQVKFFQSLPLAAGHAQPEQEQEHSWQFCFRFMAMLLCPGHSACLGQHLPAAMCFKKARRDGF